MRQSVYIFSKYVKTMFFLYPCWLVCWFFALLFAFQKYSDIFWFIFLFCAIFLFCICPVSFISVVFFLYLNIQKKKKNNKKTRADRQPPETVSAPVCTSFLLWRIDFVWSICFRPTSNCYNIVLGITYNSFLHGFLKYGLSLFRWFKSLGKWAVSRWIWEWKTWQRGVTPPSEFLYVL